MHADARRTSSLICISLVQWSYHAEDEATWEHEEELRIDYPEVFPSASKSRG
jgi:hypothetical protein